MKTNRTESRQDPAHPDAAEGLPHSESRERRQPYAAEHDDYNDGVATPPEEQRGRTPPDPKRTGPKTR
jgi:hypothetical protein